MPGGGKVSEGIHSSLYIKTIENTILLLNIVSRESDQEVAPGTCPSSRPNPAAGRRKTLREGIPTVDTGSAERT